ncbi:MAG: bifunctional aspartate kinase/homoserine dehydrogenase I [Rickettsiales bacterium]|nr:MAG: bifunctional aspartate kinase/homoserine dehydrogenase I [Rickettsiales bacterium]
MFKVYKFGGSILKNANDVKLIASVLSQEKSINVFSAFFGITDSLIRVSKIACEGLKEYEMQLEFIANFHINICKELEIEYDFVDEIFAEIKKGLDAIFLLNDLPVKILDKITGCGELLSSKIVCAYTKGNYVDAREVIKTDSNYSKAKVDLEKTTKNLKSAFKENESYIIAGFIGTDSKNNATTLGRNGSDYSAALIASIVGASEIVIWKDVDGLSTANPKVVPETIEISKISYKEMAELSYFGNKIIALQALQPAIEKDIKINLRNIYNLENKGTIISNETDENFAIKGISKVDDITLVSITGFAMVGISGFSKRVFTSLSSVGVSVIFISQSSSEINICFGIKSNDLEKTKLAINEEFKNEIKEEKLELKIKDKQSIIAVAGYGMANTPGVSGRIFSSLGKAKVNIVAIAQDFSEMNVSFSVDAEQADLAVRVMHRYLYKDKTANLLIAGKGVVGGTLIKMLENNKKFNVVGSFNSKEYNGESYKDYDDIIAKFKQKADVNYVLVDCTSSEELVKNYANFIKNGFNIVTPNKKANTLPLKDLEQLQKTFNDNKKHFFYEANVGAGLPIISTINDLLESGDEIIKIEGIFSGTLSYIFNNLSASQNFSDIVKDAKEKGFTEPDPNEDLCGLDVGRKLLILARSLGYKLDLKDVKIESLVGISDADVLKKMQEAEKNNSVLRYVGSIENGKVGAKLEVVSNKDALSSTQWTDNIISITSKYYNKTPLVIKGAGAGAEVTGVGIISDLSKLYNLL